MKALIFDLDGTLIDSSPSILAGFRAAFAACGREPVRPLAPDVIGPPLRETLALLAGSEDDALLQRLSAAFKAHYDTEGYRLTTVFAGVATMLAALAAAGHPLFIATNKRLHPTRLILAHLGWEKFFTAAYALDSFAPPAPNKAALLGRILAERHFPASTGLYIGDREEDAAAAAANALPFAWATWGYDATARAGGDWMRLDRPGDLVAQLAAC